MMASEVSTVTGDGHPRIHASQQNNLELATQGGLGGRLH